MEQNLYIPGVNEAEYGSNTYRFFEALQQGNVRLDQVGDFQNVYILQSSETEQVAAENIRRIDPSNEHIKAILLYGKDDTETREEYSKRAAMFPAELSMFIAPDPRRGVTRDSVFNTLLNRPQIPTASEVGHILMELRHPGLFLETYDQEENRRNYVLSCFFQYANQLSAAGAERPWLAMLQNALQHYGCKATVRRRFLETMETAPMDPEILTAWNPGYEALQTASVDYSVFRRACRGEYCANHGITRIESFYEAIQERYHCTNAYVSGFFAAPDPSRNRGSREFIIDIGIAMGCSLKQINKMLMEANRAFVYPLSSWPEERAFAEAIAGNRKA